MPAVKGAFCRITVTFAEPQRRRKIGSGQFPDGIFCLFIGAWFDLPPMRRKGDEVSLPPIVLGHFKETNSSGLMRGIDNFGLDHCIHFSIGAEALPTRLASANDVGSLRIAQVGFRIGLFTV